MLKEKISTFIGKVFTYLHIYYCHNADLFQIKIWFQNRRARERREFCINI